MTDAVEIWCTACVYHPPNLPRSAYAPDDWRELQTKTCAYDCQPDDARCRDWRKTSCSLVDLEQLNSLRR